MKEWLFFYQQPKNPVLASKVCTITQYHKCKKLERCALRFSPLKRKRDKWRFKCCCRYLVVAVRSGPGIQEELFTKGNLRTQAKGTTPTQAGARNAAYLPYESNGKS